MLLSGPLPAPIRHPHAVSYLGFCLLAPDSQIARGRFAKLVQRDSIRKKVKKRVRGYSGAKDQWHTDWFQPTPQRIVLGVISWEELIDFVGEHDPESAGSMGTFLKHCIDFDQ